MSVNIQTIDGKLFRVASMNGTNDQQAALQVDSELSLTSPRPVENRVVTKNLSILNDNIFILKDNVDDLQQDTKDLANAIDTGIIENCFYTNEQDVLVTNNEEVISFRSSLDKENIGNNSNNIDISNLQNIIELNNTDNIVIVSNNQLKAITYEDLLNLIKASQDKITIDTELNKESDNPISNKAISTSIDEIKESINNIDIPKSITIDNTLDIESTNPVQNKIITTELETVKNKVNNISVPFCLKNYVTPSSGGTESGSWFKLARMTITVKYTDAGVLGELWNHTTAADIPIYCKFRWWVKQQADLGNPPINSLKIYIADNFQPEYLKSIIIEQSTSKTIIELYVQLSHSYTGFNIIYPGIYGSGMIELYDYRMEGCNLIPNIPTGVSYKDAILI